MKLNDMEVLALDCQATSSNPNTGVMLEMGWMKTRASQGFDPEQLEKKVEAYLVKPPEDFEIPDRVLKITGIEHNELKQAITRRTAWQRLKRAAGETAEFNNQSICHAVIHFSRYEEPFLRGLHDEFSGKGQFPFHILCTHDLVKRILPGLPRKGLRAVAGYFGQSLSVLRRSSHHVGATAFVWHHLVKTLSESYGINTLDSLQEWLTQAPPVSGSKSIRQYPMDRELRMNLSDGPGLYKMFRSNGDILYVGKAKSLKRRVNSYFQKRSRHAEHILEMLSQAKQITTEPTETALEAALKESDEIKKFSPPYNIALQKRERQVVFFAKDLCSCDETPSLKYPIGPFASSVFMSSWARMTALLNENQIQKIELSTIEDILGTPPDYAPDEECFAQGARLFKDEYTELAKGQFSLNSLLKLGSLFWKERLDELAAAEKEMEGESAEEEETTLELEAEEAAPDMPSWNPEKIARAFKSIIRTGAHEARRARWFCRLSESTVAWDNKKSNSQAKNVILFEQGNIQSRDTIESVIANPVPAGFRKTYFERQKNMDLATFDRMRILTTEIKRLLEGKRALEVCLGPRTTLKEEQLKRIFKWV